MTGGRTACDLNCLQCKFDECINDREMSRQYRYYLRNREKCLERKREAYWRKKNEEENNGAALHCDTAGDVSGAEPVAVCLHEGAAGGERQL